MRVRPFHHQRPLAAAAAAFGLGVWAGIRFVWRPLPVWIAGGLCLTVAALLPRIGRRRILGVIGLFLFFGMLLSGYASHPLLPEEGKYEITGVLCGDAALREDGTAWAYLEQVTLRRGGEVHRLNRVYWTYHPEPQAPFLPREGDRASFSGRLYHPEGQMNPYGFDCRLYLLQKGAAAGISGAREALVADHPGRGLKSLTYQARSWLDEKIRAVFGEESALPEALLAGIRDNLPPETVQAFSDVGLAHLLAISGLHVGLLAEALLLPLRALTGRKTQFVILAGFLLFYCALLDFSAPVVRASLLMVFAKGRRLARRAPDPLTALAAAFLLILVFRPLDLFSASFQLSFCAVLGLAALLPALEGRGGGLRGRFLRSMAATASVMLCIAVPTIQIFHRLSLLGLVLNPVVCILFALLLPLYLLVLVVGCVWLPAGQMLAGMANAVSGWIEHAVQALGRLPFATVSVPFLPWYCVAAVAFALALATRYILWPGKRKVLVAACCLASAFLLWPMTACRDVQYIQLAMGQADSALIMDSRRTFVIDAGKYGGDLASCLLSMGRKADVLVLTHLHADHCQGVRQLIDNRVPIGEVWLPEGAEEQRIDDSCLSLIREMEEMGVPVRHLAAGDIFREGRVGLTVLWPEAGTVPPNRDANRYSLALLCDLDGVKLLSAADIPGNYEMYAARDADLIKIAHHGSKSSTGDEFLSVVTPDAALITGSDTAALPHPDLLERLSRRGIPWYNTAEWGAVTVTVRSGGAIIAPYLHAKEQP